MYINTYHGLKESNEVDDRLQYFSQLKAYQKELSC